mmetsp:Transcript_14565/g.37101  ORF Transcript_14565/g.37101 Transcript_14565/m.37101 type:complete len:157 (+) Transcript_14565:92-562(+)|eukprot:CAMPEP_0177668020 /NCGR_PEP_ID=MMETSP0447-20121125/22485_1 /TAXON_ID=0 /ORGANISM="Stygamoeba regulata, Strain BSH-02190019" /LENGTH=156 /DNA_ID=CAMNT_0019174393 /DNA_START=69 /DNA_END=539 /DNA_ORIENTATION=-
MIKVPTTERKVSGGAYQHPEIFQTAVTVSDPQKHETEDGTFVDYKIEAESSFPHFAGKTYTCRRRYNDFVWLRAQLQKEIDRNDGPLPVRPLPELPNSESLFGWFTGERFTPEFIQKRMVDLDKWLNQVANHDISCESKHLLAFFRDKSLTYYLDW